MQIDTDKERFSEVFSKFFDVKKEDVLDFITKDENGIKNIFYHPTSFSSDNNFVNKIIEFKELNSIFKNMDYDYQINSSTAASRYMQNLLGQFKDRERFTCVFLNTQNNVIANKIFEGTVDEAPVFKREIIKLALNYDAKSVLIGHNHPGGSVSPSKADRNSTRILEESLDTVGIKLLDHIIVAGSKEYSFAENSLLNVLEEKAEYKTDQKTYKFHNKDYDINEIKEMYKEYGKKLEVNYNKEDYEKFKDLKKIFDEDKRQNIRSLKKDTVEKVKNIVREI